MFQLSPLDECKTFAESAVITIEKRRCIYAFDVCARSGANRASGSGKFDADALLNCLRNLSEQLSRPDQCATEVEKGCELVVRRCCEGLASYVRDRGDNARLAAVSECADMISIKIKEVISAVTNLTNNHQAVEEIVLEDVVGLESAMFEEYLENIRQTVSGSVRIGWLDQDAAPSKDESAHTFPSYLSASLLAIVRCRAQVEECLGDRVRHGKLSSCIFYLTLLLISSFSYTFYVASSRTVEGVTYQNLTMTTVAEGVVEGICKEVTKRKLNLKVRQADTLANELEFLRNTLKRFLGKDTVDRLEATLHMVSSKAGRGRDYQGGPDGLAALEELERLGRVYVLCLGD